MGSVLSAQHAIANALRLFAPDKLSEISAKEKAGYITLDANGRVKNAISIFRDHITFVVYGFSEERCKQALEFGFRAEPFSEPLSHRVRLFDVSPEQIASHRDFFELLTREAVAACEATKTS